MTAFCKRNVVVDVRLGNHATEKTYLLVILYAQIARLFLELTYTTEKLRFSITVRIGSEWTGRGWHGHWWAVEV